MFSSAEQPISDAELYILIRSNMKTFLRSLCRADWEDRLHDIFIATRKALRAGTLRDTANVVAYARGTARFLQWRENRNASKSAQLCAPASVTSKWSAGQIESAFAYAEQRASAKLLIRRLGTCNRAVITRFYLDDEPWRSICASLGLTKVQFRTRKTRALARLRAMQIKQRKNGG